jgi:hypothetical protein
MSFVISINGNLSYNFLELYNQIEILEILNNDVNICNMINIYKDIDNNFNNYNNNYNLNYTVQNIFVNINNDIEYINFLYRDCYTNENNNIYINNNNYIGKFKDGNFFLIKINYYKNITLANCELYISHNYNLILEDKNIFYSNDIINYENFKILKVINYSIIDIKIKKNMFKQILHDNINDINFRIALNNKFKKNILLEAQSALIIK